MNYKTYDDKELWERCQQGDEGAFAELFERYSPRMRCIATSYIKDSMQAEELVMDSFFHLWVKRKQTLINGKFQNYLTRCIHNSVIDHLRKSVPTTIGLEELGDTHPIDCAIDSGLLSEEIRDVFQKALERLSPRRKEVFLLSRYENLSYAEIAQKMNLTVATIESHMVAALAGLRSNMKKYYISILLFIILPFV